MHPVTDLLHLQPPPSQKSLSKRSATEPVVSIGIEVPFTLRPYLASTHSRSDICSIVQTTRDRRLRLLLRRFTNQIQYGCKNPQCETPACWSFRRRISQTPIRPYNDLTARTLAWHCLEDYTAREARYGHIDEASSRWKRDGRRNYGVAGRDGLCWNDPVVPWYKELRTSGRQATCTDHRQSYDRINNRHECDILLQHLTPDPRMERSSGPISESSNNRVLLHQQSIASPSGPQNANYDGCAELGKSEELLFQYNPPINNLPDNDQTVGMRSSDRPQGSAESGPIPFSHRKDYASFSQTFFDTAVANSFDSDVVRGPNSSQEGYLLESATISTSNPPDRRVRTEEAVIDGRADDRQGSVPTFKYLPTSVLVWLRHMLSRQPQQADTANVGISNDKDSPNDVMRFAKQSLFFSLSHPVRLLDSARMWRFDESHRNIKKVVSDERALDMLQEIVQRVAQTEQTVMQPASRPFPRFRDAIQAFALLAKIRPYTETLNHLNEALQHAYTLPTSLKLTKASSENHHTHAEDQLDAKNNLRSLCYLKDEQVADLCLIVLLAFVRCDRRLAMSPLVMWDDKTISASRSNYLMCRDLGSVFPHSQMFQIFPKSTDRHWRAKYKGVLQHADANDDPCFLSLLETFSDVISHRLALHEIIRTTKSQSVPAKRAQNVVDRIVQLLSEYAETSCESDTNQTACFLLELMSLLLLKQWNRKAIVQRTSAVGGALQMMAGLYRSRAQFSIPTAEFQFNFVADAFDCAKMPVEWMRFREDNKQIHMLSFSFLFDPAILVKYFRAINIETMRRSYQYASLNQHHVRRSLYQDDIPLYGSKGLLAALRPHMALYFVLTASRSNALEDAINQIWRRQRQELMRPLKVVLGKDEGEDGLDHGGVQQEFFRLVLAEALSPDYGMFLIDEKTRMTWFQPGSIGSLYKFEAIGILMSLAVYNGVTLPVTFPLAFYRKLLGLKVKQLEHIRDGWPDLVKGLSVLRDWEDGDVGDVIARTYEFTYELYGAKVSIDMSRTRHHDTLPMPNRLRPKEKGKTATFDTFCHNIPTPPFEDEPLEGKSTSRQFSFLESTTSDMLRSSTPTSILSGDTGPLVDTLSSPAITTPSQEAPLVTNANRLDYIKDYVFWLTDKTVSSQYEAFAKGFYTCLDRTALSIFTAEALKSVIEGYTTIDIDGLQAAATYDEYAPNDQVIIDFWSVVRDFSPEQHRKLLEFVTASDRVPVNGIKSVVFLIQRNGVGDDRLPSSATCYGRLLLPTYSSKEILREKLAKAIENSVGFGSL